MRTYTKGATKYSHVFRKDCYRAFRAARNTTLAELAEVLNIPYGTLGHVFGSDCKNKANWRNILRVADILNVPRVEYIAYHWVRELPPEMESYKIPDVKLKRKRSKVWEKGAGSPNVKSPLTEQIEELYLSGMSPAQIAAKLNIDNKRVSRTVTNRSLVRKRDGKEPHAPLTIDMERYRCPSPAENQWIIDAIKPLSNIQEVTITTDTAVINIKRLDGGK